MRHLATAIGAPGRPPHPFKEEGGSSTITNDPDPLQCMTVVSARSEQNPVPGLKGSAASSGIER